MTDNFVIFIAKQGSNTPVDDFPTLRPTHQPASTGLPSRYSFVPIDFFLGIGYQIGPKRGHLPSATRETVTDASRDRSAVIDILSLCGLNCHSSGAIMPIAG